MIFIRPCFGLGFGFGFVLQRRGVLFVRIVDQRFGSRRQGQCAVAHAQPLQQRLDRIGQIAAKAQEAACAHGQFGDERQPVALAQPRGGQRSAGNIGLGFREMRDERGVVDPAALLADDFRALSHRDHVGQRFEPQPRGGQQAGIAPWLRTAEQVQQLAILGTRTRLRAGLVAQDCGEAIVELHGGEGRKLLR